MIQLNEKQRAEAVSLLEDYQKICDALHDTKRKFRITLSSESDEHDFEEVEISSETAAVALASEKKWTEDRLKKLGIEV